MGFLSLKWLQIWFKCWKRTKSELKFCKFEWKSELKFCKFECSFGSLISKLLWGGVGLKKMFLVHAIPEGLMFGNRFVYKRKKNVREKYFKKVIRVSRVLIIFQIWNTEIHTTRAICVDMTIKSCNVNSVQKTTLLIIN